MPNYWKYAYDDPKNPKRETRVVEYDDNDKPTGQSFPVDVTLQEGAKVGGTGVGEVIVPRANVHKDERGYLDKALDFLPGIGTGVAGEVTRNKTKDLIGKGLLATATGRVAPALAAAAAHYLMTGGVAQARKSVPSIFGTNTTEPSIKESLLEGVLDRVTGRAFEGIIDAPGQINKVRSQGGVRNSLINKLGELIPTPKAQKSSLDDMLQFGKEFDAPTPTLFALGEGELKGIIEPSITARSRVGIVDKMAEAENKALMAILKQKPIGPTGKPLTMESSAFDIAKSHEAKSIAAHKVIKNLEKKAHRRLEGAIELSPKDILLPDGTIAQIRGAVPIDNVQDFAKIVQDAGGSLFQEPLSQYPGIAQLHERIGKVNKLINEIITTEPDLFSQRVLIPYKNSKEIRDALDDIVQIDSKQSGLAEKLRNMLSQAEDAGVGDASLGWVQGSRPAYEQAREITKKRSEIYNPSIAEKISTVKDTRQKAAADLETETIFANGMQNRERAEKLVAAAGGDSTEVAFRFIKGGWDHAIDKKTGTIDGEKFYNYFFDGRNHPENVGIFQSEKILNNDQRRIIRQLGNYAKNAKFSGDTPGWQDARIINGLVTLGTGTLSGLLTGKLPHSMIIGGAFGVGLPFTREFVEKLILDPKGAKLLVNRLHPVSQQQSYNTTKQMLRLLGVGARVFLTGPEGYTPAKVNSDGKLEPEQ